MNISKHNILVKLTQYRPQNLQPCDTQALKTKEQNIKASAQGLYVKRQFNTEGVQKESTWQDFGDQIDTQ